MNIKTLVDWSRDMITLVYPNGQRQEITGQELEEVGIDVHPGHNMSEAEARDLHERVERFRRQREKEMDEWYKHRGVPNSDTPTLTELPGQGRCVGYVVGQRTWPVNIERAVVTSGYDTEWLPGEPVKAMDPGPTFQGHGAGLYAMKLGEEITMPTGAVYGMRSLYAAGLVALWGRIKEHERGFRAEWAYPLEFQHLSLDGPFADAMLAVLNERYGCRKHSERANAVQEDGVVGGINQALNALWTNHPQSLQQQLNNQQAQAQRIRFSQLNNPFTWNP